MIMPYVMDMSIEKSHPALFDKVYNMMHDYVEENKLEVNEIFQTVNLLKYSWVHDAFETKLKHEDETAREKLR